jgi:ABC-2 type transport system ATP-binding protein/lipopolysaccharide transport system ATP-binding protein
MRSDVIGPGNGALPSVTASGLGKHYNLGELTSLRRTLGRLKGRSAAPPGAGLEALAGVDFTVARGEAVGIVGSNGSGKSTLLQILAGTTLPTRGEMRVYGSVLPLLAVGLGFHPELTGRENVTLFAASLGVSTTLIVQRMDDITAFAELERHMDTPIKRFSSGMMSRLSFAIAVQIPADIYIFDEVLAVVDAEYQQRCMTEIKGLHAQGRTIFFVSHHREQVEEVCDRVLWLDAGTVRDFGPTSRVLAEYDEEMRLSA